MDLSQPSEIARATSLPPQLGEGADSGRGSLFFVDTGSSLGTWLRAEEVKACPRCNSPFTTTFRRHHCRQCGCLVCDDCSKSRLRLPGQPMGAKVRVCDSCVGTISQNRASGFEEDLAVNSEIIDHLRTALSQSYQECEAFKRVLLELVGESSGDTRLLDLYAQDPESDAHAFSVLQERVQQRWAEILNSLEQQASMRQVMEGRHRQLLALQEETAAQLRELHAHKTAMGAELTQAAQTEAQRSELLSQESEMKAALASVRRQVHELELERQALLQQSRWRTRHHELRAMEASIQGAVPQPFTISTGRQDPQLRPGRTGGCRRYCRQQ